MPLVSEIATGASFERSAKENTLADRATRVFRIISDVPGVAPNIQATCGVFIGNPHPENGNIYCTSFRFAYEDDSRVVILATFEYQATPASSSDKKDKKEQPPEVRPANWTTSTALIETPVYKWRPRTDVNTWGAEKEAANAAGDIYEGIAQLTGMVNISITQEFSTDPTEFNEYCGYINEDEITLGSLVMAPHTVMFRGVQSQPYVESYGDTFFRGWKATYEFAYKKNRTKIAVPTAAVPGSGFGPGFEEKEVDLGWDIAVPQSGHNVLAFDPATAAQDDDVFGQPLLHGDAQATDPAPAGMPSAEVMRRYAGVVIPPADGGYLLPQDVNPGNRMPAMLKIFSYEGGNKGCSQARASSPIPLNPNGRPRNETADPKVLVYGYQVQPSINFANTLGLRLY